MENQSELRLTSVLPINGYNSLLSMDIEKTFALAVDIKFVLVIASQAGEQFMKRDGDTGPVATGEIVLNAGRSYVGMFVHPSEVFGTHNSRRQRSKQHGTSSLSELGANRKGSFTFLFVVNSLSVRKDAEPLTDQWGARMPPECALDYEAEGQGAVWRYRDGVIERAQGYDWDRDYEVHPVTGLMPEGCINLIDRDGVRWPMPEYKKFTVFNCWGPLPCVYVRGDVLSMLIGPYGNGDCWRFMSFERHDHSGVTRIAEAGNAQTVVGRNPSWMPSLVPEMFRSLDRNAPPSEGLSGELGVILGQMALTESYSRTDKPFELKDPTDLRGVLVVICLDSYENEEGSTAGRLRSFEEQGVIVRE
ncbi:hypothetical protein FHL15_009606 [Xylaria flabelliformis]|uniref:Uncharacterized protein n=1 Tax=Xylaria flabelliformis TaxID=2512241 RepID=A0A553HND4_9PEZI|nr:hypothetical protein FHL15_009606 [Xylaria flabelliformis]